MIIWIVLVLAYLVAPAEAKVIITIINILMPDSLPAVDEIAMVAGLFMM